MSKNEAIVVICIPADTNGNLLWVKNLRQKGDRMFVDYRSTYNDIPFRETEIYLVDGGENVAITGDDGTVLYRFSVDWISLLVS